jgi:hypothetical protein
MDGGPVAAGRKTESIPVDHPVLGPALSIYDDRHRSRITVAAYGGFFCLGIIGVLLGRGDLLGGADVLGWAEVAGGAFLALYSIRAVVMALIRLRRPVVLVVGRNGFEYARGNGPVGWEEVATVSNPGATPTKPKPLRVRLGDPEDYARRHALSPLQRYMLRIHDNDVLLDLTTLMPAAAVEAEMNERLAEFGRARQGPGGAASAAANRRPKQRPPGKR